MPKRKEPLWLIWKKNDSHVSKQIYREFEQYAKDTGFYPTQLGLYHLMTQPVWIKVEGRREPICQEAHYPKLTQGSYDHWFDRLVEEGYIKIDGRTRAISSTALIIVEKEDRSPDLE